MALGVDDLDDGLTRAFSSFLALYSESGGHRFHGFTDYGDPRNYQGPLIWSEGDCQFRFALALEDRFRGMVHLEVPLAKYSVHDYDPEFDRRQFVDIVVSDLSGFDAERDVFAERQRDLFVEVKYVGHSSEKWWFDSRRTISAGVWSDLDRLKRNVELGRCRAAALLLVDDNSLLEGSAGEGMPWSTQVRPLLASPAQLARLELALRLRVALPASCAACGSPRVASILWGMPTPEMEAAAARAEVDLSGCEPLGGGRDATFRCLDCRFSDERRDPVPELRD